MLSTFYFYSLCFIIHFLNFKNQISTIPMNTTNHANTQNPEKKLSLMTSTVNNKSASTTMLSSVRCKSNTSLKEQRQQLLNVVEMQQLSASWCGEGLLCGRELLLLLGECWNCCCWVGSAVFCCEWVVGFFVVRKKKTNKKQPPPKKTYHNKPSTPKKPTTKYKATTTFTQAA